MSKINVHRICLLFAISAIAGCGNQTKYTLSDAASLEKDDRGNVQLKVFNVEKFSSDHVSDPLSVGQIIVTDVHFSDQDLDLFTKFEKLKTLDVSHTRISSAAAPAISNFSRLEQLKVRNTKIDDEFFQQLKIESLKSIDASNCDLTSTAVQSISSCPRIRELDLSHNRKIKDDVFDHLGKISSLEELHLNGMLLTGIGIEALSETQLQVLRLSETPLDGDAAAKIANLKSLQLLDLGSNPNLTSQSLSTLGGHQELADLDISNTSVNDEIFSTLITIPKLRRLCIANCDISEQAILANYKKMQNLRFLEISGLDVSKDAIRDLRIGRIEIKKVGERPGTHATIE